MPAHHPLDRPVWGALTTRQAALALGGAQAVRIDPAYGLFIAAADRSPQSVAALAALLPEEGEVAMVEAEEWPDIPGAIAQPPAAVTQMVARDLKLVEPEGYQIVDLSDFDADEMFALATLTKPGPFFERTHRLGDFVGVKVDGRLVAMAGERLRLPGFTEVSGVCTHPDHRGHGYAAALMSVVAGRIQGWGETPFLHVYAHNVGAIRLYEALGYRVRRVMNMTVLKRA